MTSNETIAIAATSLCLLATSAFAAGPFDGKWVGESARCSPASSTYRFNNLTVSNSSFNWTATDRGRSSRCKVSVNRDGSFESPKDCDFQLTGKLEDKKGTIRIKTSERDCEIAAKRE